MDALLFVLSLVFAHEDYVRAELAFSVEMPGAARRYLDRARQAGHSDEECRTLEAHCDALDALKACKNPLERFEAIRKFGTIRHRRAADLMLKIAREDQFPELQMAALMSLGQMKVRSSVPGLIALMRRVQGDVRTAVMDALVAITGVSKGEDARAWSEWWDENGEAFLAGKYTPRPAERSGTTTFYGLKVDSKKVMFAIDLSGSMSWPASYSEMRMIITEMPEELTKMPTRFDVARWQLKRALRQLKEDVSFDLMFFNGDVTRFRSELAPANKQNVPEAIAFVDRLEPDGPTNFLLTLREALREPGLEALYLLSDGLPSFENQTPHGILREVDALNATAKVAIHTVFIGASTTAEFDAGSAFMQKLAKGHRGEWVCLGVRPEKR